MRSIGKSEYVVLLSTLHHSSQVHFTSKNCLLSDKVRKLTRQSSKTRKKALLVTFENSEKLAWQCRSKTECKGKFQSNVPKHSNTCHVRSRRFLLSRRLSDVSAMRVRRYVPYHMQWRYMWCHEWPSPSHRLDAWSELTDVRRSRRQRTIQERVCSLFCYFRRCFILPHLTLVVCAHSDDRRDLRGFKTFHGVNEGPSIWRTFNSVVWFWQFYPHSF